ncbi:MAG: hypothetical protein HY280_06195 [Nitrospinae bacterium]|nr:hypothetical protein [Nitrospinota bacterium]
MHQHELVATGFILLLRPQGARQAKARRHQRIVKPLLGHYTSARKDYNVILVNNTKLAQKNAKSAKDAKKVNNAKNAKALRPDTGYKCAYDDKQNSEYRSQETGGERGKASREDAKNAKGFSATFIK